MELERDGTRQPGRWVLAPKKEARFLGSRERERVRARERRRRIFVGLLEAIALTALMGVFPPLRGMFMVTGVLVVLLAVYTVLIVRMAHGAAAQRVAFDGEAVAEIVPQRVIRLPQGDDREPLLRQRRAARAGWGA